MKRIFIVLLIPLTLASCAAPSKIIAWHKLPKEELQAVCNAYKNLSDSLAGCAYNTPSRCDVYTLDKLADHSRCQHEALGHEIDHCFNGHYHKQPVSLSKECLK